MYFKFFLSISTLIFLTGCSSVSLLEYTYSRSPSSVLDVSCIGPESANTYVIYLHGIDSKSPSPQEMKNRVILNDIAKIKNIRFALPRAQMQCPTQSESICWGWKFDQVELSSILPLIVGSRTSCFESDKPFMILGFSNGGYLLMRWYSAGINPSVLPQPNRLIASGSGKGRIPDGITDLSKNPNLTLIIGKQDQFNFDPAETIYHQIESLNAPIQLIEFEGGHVLDEKSLLKIIN